MRIILSSSLIAAGLAASVPALAHGGGVFVAAPRVSATPHASTHYKTTFRTSVVLTGTVGSSGVAYQEGASEITVFAVPTEAQRYMTATGRVLPAVHGNILLPPATPTGDYTYIWTTSLSQ